MSLVDRELLKIKRLTKEQFRDLASLITGATYEELQLMLDRPGTTMMTTMIIKICLAIADKGDMHALQILLDRLIGKVKDEIDVNVKPTIIKRSDGSQVILGMKAKEEE